MVLTLRAETGEKHGSVKRVADQLDIGVESLRSWVHQHEVDHGARGDVDAADLRAVLAGLAPSPGLTPNGAQLTSHPRHAPGFDLTFGVPKSVSIVYALGDPLVQGEPN